MTTLSRTAFLRTSTAALVFLATLTMGACAAPTGEGDTGEGTESTAEGLSLGPIFSICPTFPTTPFPLAGVGQILTQVDDRTPPLLNKPFKGCPTVFSYDQLVNARWYGKTALDIRVTGAQPELRGTVHVYLSATRRVFQPNGTSSLVVDTLINRDLDRDVRAMATLDLTKDYESFVLSVRAVKLENIGRPDLPLFVEYPRAVAYGMSLR